ncbi:MAG: aquaporin [Actinomycetota bacterium]
MNGSLGRRMLAEGVGAAFLLIGIVGSGIVATRLGPDSPALQLTVNAVVTGAVLAAMILVFAPLSGAHFNPAVTMMVRMTGRITNRDAMGYVSAQVIGAIAGAVLANLMFALPAIELSTTVRGGIGVGIGEFVATVGLILVIGGFVRSGAHPGVIAAAVGTFITAAILSTSSASFANPAVTLARMLSDTFAGIAPRSVPVFLVAELVAAFAAVGLLGVLFPVREGVRDG